MMVNLSRRFPGNVEELLDIADLCDHAIGRQALEEGLAAALQANSLMGQHSVSGATRQRPPFRCVTACRPHGRLW
jgi:hypothetical protein